MINPLFFQFKTFGSYALRCGCSYFGVRAFAQSFPSQMVFVFKNRTKSQNFIGWLTPTCRGYQTEFYYKEEYKKGQMLHLVFVNCALHIKGSQTKLYYRSFRLFCNAALTIYKSSKVHPNKSASFQQLKKAF